MTRPNIKSCRLYAILDTTYFNGRDGIALAQEMINGGVDIIQLRAKKEEKKEIVRLAQQVLKLTRPAGIPLIINDHPDIAVEVDADGVHIGQDDFSVSETRKKIGREKWIGKSTHSLEQAVSAQKEDVDYIGVGPVFATPTKPDYKPVGLNLVREVAPTATLPFFCIGGIKLENLSEVLKAGAKRIVVVSGILLAPSPSAYCKQLRKILEIDS